MVIPTGPSLERRNLPFLDTEFKTGDSKGSERPARLQHKFLVLRKLGQGTYGKVQLALNKETNQEVAIKTIKKARIESEEDMLRIRREIYIMKSIRHPYIIHIHEVFETRQKIVIVMQYASGGELYDYLGCHNTLPEDEARRIFRQIASAIYYCHKNKICHRDLKLENILLDEEGNAQIADFGLSNIFDERRRMDTFCGSPLYASPEIVKGTPYKGPEVDCWSLGVLLYTLIYGTMPFDGRNFKDLVSQISEGRYEEPTNVSNASGLIRRLLTPEISKRATISDVCKDAWVNQGCNESLLKIAEQLSWGAVINTRNLVSKKYSLENNITNGHGKFQSATTNKKVQNAVQKNHVLHENSSNLNLENGQVSQNIPLYEQILNYDVTFVINKLLSAVESSINCSNAETICQKLAPPVKENGISHLKIWPQNGESNTASIVESAYVIPIFEVTSVVPKTIKHIKNQNCQVKNSQQYLLENSVANGDSQSSSESISSEENKSELIIKKKGVSNKTEPINNSEEFSNGHIVGLSKKASDLPKIKINQCKENEVLQKTTNISNGNKVLKDAPQVRKIANRENSFSRIPSIKAKRTNESYLLGSKHLGPFFRTTNHALSLARLFTLNYEKLVLNTLKLPERKKKPPGKIVIPATFDPSVSPSHAQERKQIVIFPTISVSENKEKIEKKIEKIKKAALNMSLIRRSNSKNRLKIQKFLRSQAKKMQDLICDEQRSLAGSMEHLNRGDVFPNFSDSYYNFEKGNPFNLKQQNKKMNFMCTNADNINNIPTFNIARGERMENIALKDMLIKHGSSSELFTLTKSKSDTQFPSNYTYSNASYDYSMTSNISFNEHTLNIPLSDYNGRLLRSASDSEGLKFFKNAFEIDFNKECDENSELDIEISHFDFQNHVIDKSTAHLNKGISKTSFDNHLMKSFQPAKNLTNMNSFEGTLLFNKYYSEKHGNSDSLRRTYSMSDLRDFQGQTDDSNIIKCLSFMPFLKNDGCKNVTSGAPILEKQDQAGVLDKAKAFSMTVNAIFENQRRHDEKNKLKRRNTLSCIADNQVINNIGKTYSNFNNTRQNMSNSTTEFDDYLLAAYREQVLGASRANNETKFSSSPDLYPFIFGKKKNFDLFNNSKSSDNINLRAKVSNSFYEDSFCPLPSSALKSSEHSAFLRRILQESPSYENTDTDYLPIRTNRARSIGEDLLSNDEKGDVLRKLSLTHGIALGKNNPKKSPFLSKFLNDLENRENGNVKEPNLNQRRHVRSPLASGKRPKLEKKSKSFLQLLSLKRIQEAEKELEKVERSPTIDAEENESAGSLLEALKTHGYRGVIEQLFQGQDDNAMDTFDVRNPRSPYFGRKTIPDVSRFNFMYYDVLPQISQNTYDASDLDMFNGMTMTSPYEMYTAYRQNSPKQFVYDWLTTTQNSDYLTPFNMEPDLPLEIDEQNPIAETRGSSYWGKETSKSVDKETSSSESFDASQEQQTIATSANESDKTKYCFTEYPDQTSYSRSEKNPLLRTSSTSEDEREESVQDRIWRKSFYSRFNNSVLSRKERSAFLDSEFPSESRSGFNGNCSPTFKGTLRERRDSAKWNGYNKDFQTKRGHNSRKYSPSSDSSLTNYVTKTFSESPKRNFSENNVSRENRSVTPKANNTEPDH